MVPDEIKAPYYSYDDLRRQADKFLAAYHPTGTITVPIEQIVEFQFRIDIVPTAGLHQLLETDGFITSDLREFWVDQFIYRESLSLGSGLVFGVRVLLDAKPYIHALLQTPSPIWQAACSIGVNGSSAKPAARKLVVVQQKD